jgi:hypothetical protein
MKDAPQPTKRSLRKEAAVVVDEDVEDVVGELEEDEDDLLTHTMTMASARVGGESPSFETSSDRETWIPEDWVAILYQTTDGTKFKDQVRQFIAEAMAVQAEASEDVLAFRSIAAPVTWASHCVKVDAIWNEFVPKFAKAAGCPLGDLVKPSGLLDAILGVQWHYPSFLTNHKSFAIEVNHFQWVEDNVKQPKWERIKGNACDKALRMRQWEISRPDELVSEAIVNKIFSAWISSNQEFFNAIDDSLSPATRVLKAMSAKGRATQAANGYEGLLRGAAKGRVTQAANAVDRTERKWARLKASGLVQNTSTNTKNKFSKLDESSTIAKKRQDLKDWNTNGVFKFWSKANPTGYHFEGDGSQDFVEEDDEDEEEE